METDSFLDDMDFFESFDQSRVLELRDANSDWELDFLHQDPESDPVLQYISQMLLEEEETAEEAEPLALQITEKSFYDALVNVESPSLSRNNIVELNPLQDSDSVLLFQRGMEEGRKFLPPVCQLDFSTLSGRSESRQNRKKHRHRDDDDDEEERRNSKQSATDFSVDEDELSEKFDRVLLNHAPPDDLKITETDESKTYGIGNGGPDLTAWLMSCAQSIAANDQTTANETLKLIKKHVSPTGDPVQRLANLFANALEARLEGTGHERYISLTSKRTSASEQLKAYRVFHNTPFKPIPVIFATQMILLKASKAKTLHIIDFGIGYGFQWPSLIQHLSQRPNGPPKLKITGIDMPQPGLRPVKRAHDTGTFLAKYCERFSVPFEYNAIATQSWESIKPEEMEASRGEVLVVNCQFYLKNLLDETVSENSPKDAVLKLIRSLNPDMLLTVHANAQLASPFFLTRFRDAFFFYSTLFDALDSLLPREDEQRLRFEQDLYGGQVMNLVACEGRARVERAESYKQWQTRCIRAGFKVMPLRKDMVKELRNRAKKNYHKDFVFDEDGFWLLQGWKGKIITALSCWVPT